MGIKRGSISTPIIADGLVFNMDAANRASYIPNATTSYNTIDISTSGSLDNGVQFLQPPLSSSTWEFDGIDSYLEISKRPLGINQAISVSSWCKTSDNVGYGVIINEDNWGNKRNWNLSRKNDDFFFTVWHDTTGTNSTSITTSTVNVSDGNWHNIVGVWDGTTNTNSFKVYFDGNEIDQTTPTTTGINIEATFATIGNASQQYSGYQPWDGSISSIQIYDRGLSANEVLHNYNALKSRFGL